MPPDGVRIRPVEQRDLQAWVAMRRALWPDEDASELQREAARFLETRKALGLAAVLVSERVDSSLSGFVEIGVREYADGCENSPVPYVEGWFVAPEMRRSGIGGALIAATEAWAIERGYSELASDALLENSVSERAHKALGFKEVERAIRFRKALSRSGAP